MKFYMNQDEDMAVTDYRDENGTTPFCNGLKQNLEKFLSEDENVLEQAQKEFEKNFYSK